MSYTARRRLEEMEACGLAGQTMRKSIQLQNRLSENLGLSKVQGEGSSRYQRYLLDTTNYFNRAKHHSDQVYGEMERFEATARINGQRASADGMKRSKTRKLQ